VLFNLLEGKKVNLRITEKEDLSIVKKWDNDLGIMGEFEPIVQETKADLERQFDKLNEGIRESATSAWTKSRKSDSSYVPVFAIHTYH